MSMEEQCSQENREINYFAFLDFEATGINGSPRITEMAIVACSKKEFLENCQSGEVPRVINKLTLCFNPCKLIEPKAEELSGLDNYMLEKENSFNENAGNLLRNFLNHLIKPACIVAHNGNKFDFPLLKETLKNINVDIPDSIHFIDSLQAIKEIDKKEKELYKRLNEEDSDLLKNVNVNINTEKMGESNIEKSSNSITTDCQKHNETTPRRPTYPENIARKKRVDVNDYLSGDEEIDVKVKKNKEVCRNIFPLITSIRSSVPKTNDKKLFLSYSLSALYERRLRKKFNAHRAENDVLALLEVALSYGDDFVSYVENKIFK